MKTWHNLQQRSLYCLQRLTTVHTVRQCTCIWEADPLISIRRAPFYYRKKNLISKPFFFLRKYQGKLQNMVKKKWQGNILLIFVFTGLLPSSKRGRGPAYLLGEDHFILTGIWKIFLEINILARSWVKIKINMLSHNEAKYSINRQLDNKWKIYLKNVAYKPSGPRRFYSEILRK